MPAKKNEIIRKVKAFLKARDGSEALEMVYSACALCFIILTAMLIIGYALQTNQVSYAAKRTARYVEVGGTATQRELNIMLREMLPNADKLGATVSVENATWYGNSVYRKIQLRDGFTIKIKAYYEVPLAVPGADSAVKLRLPITVRVSGQSEVYWK